MDTFFKPLAKFCDYVMSDLLMFCIEFGLGLFVIISLVRCAIKG